MAEHPIETLLGAPAGAQATVCPDWFVINDGESHAATVGTQTVAHPEKVVVYHDHDVPTGRSEASVIYAEILNFARRVGAAFEQARGIGYLDMLDTRVKPGQIVACGGEHAGIYGAVGAVGIRLENDALRAAMVSGSVNVTVPETLRVAVTGELQGDASILDAALAWAAQTDVCGKAVAFVSSGLSLHDRIVLCAVASMRGAFTAVCAEAGEADQTIDLRQAVPMVMLPCESRKAQPCAGIAVLETVSGMPVQAGQIGGYTGGTLEDLRLAAKLIQGKKRKRDFRLSICPATARDYLAAIDEGIIEQFVLFGAQIHAVGDRSVVIQGPGTIDRTETLLTTGLYTFSGAMGEAEGKVYTASVPAVIKAALTGKA